MKKLPYSMFRRVIIFLLFSIINQLGFSQCIDNSKIEYGDDHNWYDYCYLCPSYDFAKGGDTSKKWNFVNDDIDIRQAPAAALRFKKMVDQKIKAYAGELFFKNLKFIDLSVVYPERLQLFLDIGAQVSLEHCKAKYLYCYLFQPDTISAYQIGVAVNDRGEIVSPFKFPSKHYYKPINKNFTYCQLIDIARKAQKHIDPVESITFDYDAKTHQFYWLISQGLVDPTEGLHYVNEVKIDAADFSKIELDKGEVGVVY